MDVIVGIAGSGKTTALDAATTALGTPAIGSLHRHFRLNPSDATLA